MATKKFMPLTHFVEKQNGGWPTIAAMRWMVWKAKENGLDKHIRRIGRKVLIDENGFWEWIDKKGSEWRQ